MELKMLKKEKRLIFERDKIFEQLIENKDWIIGSIIETERVQSGRKQPFNYLSRSLEGKTKTTYITKKKLLDFKKAREQGKNVQKILHQITEINIKLLKLNQENNHE